MRLGRFTVVVAILATFLQVICGESLTVPLRLSIPNRFRCKMRLVLQNVPQPILLLYHHDSDNNRAREDMYHKVDGRYQRYFTSIKLLNKAQTFFIYHKQEHSPKACFIVPATGFAVSLDRLRDAVFVGTTAIQKNATSAAIDTCHHFRTVLDGLTVEMCADASGRPVLFESELFRADMLESDQDAFPASVFDPRAASPVACGLMGSQAPSDAEWLKRTFV